MSPPYALSDILDARGTAFYDYIGDHLVDVCWYSSTDEVALEVDYTTVNDIEQWWESEDPEVLAFSAYVGEGTLGPDEDAGLLGWLYLDDLGELRMELEVGDTYGRFLLPENSRATQVTYLCRCRTVPWAVWGCVNLDCDETNECPGKLGYYCEWHFGATAYFEAAFDQLVDP